jgi:hypothetical protein
MKHSSHINIVSLICVAMAAPGAAALARWKPVTHQGFSVQVPASWEFRSKCEFGRDARRTVWTYASSNRNFRFRVTVERDSGGDFAKHANQGWLRLTKLATDLEVTSKDVKKVDGRDVFTALAKGIMVRRKSPQPYLFFKMSTRSVSAKLIVSLTLAATAERVDAFMGVVDKIMNSFELREPTQVLPPAGRKPQPAKKGR